ncbi:hypothetical protein GCM10017690_19190 [Microbacterium terregens]
MERGLLAEVDRMIDLLSPAKRETVREIVVDAVHRGHLPPGNLRVLDSVTGSPLAGDTLSQALAESSPQPTDARRIGENRHGESSGTTEGSH